MLRIRDFREGTEAHGALGSKVSTLKVLSSRQTPAAPPPGEAPCQLQKDLLRGFLLTELQKAQWDMPT